MTDSTNKQTNNKEKNEQNPSETMAVWNGKEAMEKLEALLRAGPASENAVMDLEWRMLNSNFGFSSCQEGAWQPRPNAKKCMEERISGTVAKLDPRDIPLEKVVFSGKGFTSTARHVVYEGTINGTGKQQVVVHAYHFCDTEIGDEFCPHRLVERLIGSLSCDAVVPVRGYVWNAQSRVLWLVQPLCELPEDSVKDTVSFLRSQCEVVQQLRSKGLTSRDLKFDQVLLHHGKVCFRQRYIMGRIPLDVDPRYSSIYAEMFPQVFNFWNGGRCEAFCFQRSEENFRQICGETDREIVDRVLRTMCPGGKRFVTWEDFYRTVQLFGYWWRTADPEGLKATLDAFFANGSELQGRLTKVGECGFRASQNTPNLVVSIKNGSEVQSVHITFDTERGGFYHGARVDEDFPSPLACVQSWFSGLVILLVSPSALKANTNPYANK